jgi:hypothetical protein
MQTCNGAKRSLGSLSLHLLRDPGSPLNSAAYRRLGTASSRFPDLLLTPGVGADSALMIVARSEKTDEGGLAA